MLNPTYANSFWYFDEKAMILERLGYGEDGIGDSVGRNAFAYITWPDASFLKESILQCIRERDDGYLQFYRYPGRGGDTMSRDHVGAIIVALYINRDKKELDRILDNLPWRISRKHSQTVDFWLWQKSIKWKSFWVAQLFYILNISFFLIVIPWNYLIRKIIGIKKIDLDENPKFIKFQEKTWRWYLQKSIYPHFALFLLVWQIKILPGSWIKWALQKLLLLESNNIAIDAVLGKRISEEEWREFKPTASFIWSRRMDSSDDIQLRRLTEEESKFNDLNRGMLDYLYFQIDKIMLEFDEKIVESVKNGQKIINY
jgi:hypothetical protein